MFYCMKRFKYIWVVFFAIFFSVISCTAQDEDLVVIPVYHTEPDENKNSLHILIFGDSFSRDAFSYVPGVIESLVPGFYVDLEILYLGGKGLSYHLNYLKNEQNIFTHDIYVSDDGYWHSSAYFNGENILVSKEWDLIIFQEGSNTARNSELTESHIRGLSDYIDQRLPDVRYAFMLSPAKPQGSPALGEYTSDEVWNMYVNTSHLLLANNDVDYIIPCGTAIQNARQTSLDQYGKFGHLSYDGNHLQEGLPCLIEAYTVTQFLFNFTKMDISIEDSPLIITQEWVNKKNIPGKHGVVIEGTIEEYELCKKSALLAVENPFVISSPILQVDSLK